MLHQLDDKHNHTDTEVLLKSHFISHLLLIWGRFLPDNSRLEISSATRLLFILSYLWIEMLGLMHLKTSLVWDFRGFAVSLWCICSFRGCFNLTGMKLGRNLKLNTYCISHTCLIYLKKQYVQPLIKWVSTQSVSTSWTQDCRCYKNWLELLLPGYQLYPDTIYYQPFPHCTHRIQTHLMFFDILDWIVWMCVLGRSWSCSYYGHRYVNANVHMRSLPTLTHRETHTYTLRGFTLQHPNGLSVLHANHVAQSRVD